MDGIEEGPVRRLQCTRNWVEVFDLERSLSEGLASRLDRKGKSIVDLALVMWELLGSLSLQAGKGSQCLNSCPGGKRLESKRACLLNSVCFQRKVIIAIALR